MGKVITYDVMSDYQDKLKGTAKIACNFWNDYIIPSNSIVIRLGTFSDPGFIIARAYEPFKENEVIYSLIEFNLTFLESFNDEQIAGTLIHEMGHTLGFGWDKWMKMFHPSTGEFYPEFIKQVGELQHMLVETDYGPGTVYAHWDEERFDQELMTGIKDDFEYVLPVTIKVMSLLGHNVLKFLEEKTPLSDLIKKGKNVVFSRAGDIQNINLKFHKETKISEEIYFSKRLK